MAYLYAHLGRGTGPIMYDDVVCTGSEAELLNCHHGLGINDCLHGEDAGVKCGKEIFQQWSLS